MIKQQAKDAKVFDIINKLNKTHRQGQSGYYDCGELGIVYIYWRDQRWQWEWIEISSEFKV